MLFLQRDSDSKKRARGIVESEECNDERTLCGGRILSPPQNMNKTRIDLVNIGLMLLSGVAAFLLPFQLFLFSYAVLGPLHYLTEISWLEQKKFFLPHKTDYKIMVGLGVLIFALYIFVNQGIEYTSTFIFTITFLGALVLTFVRRRELRLVGFLGVVATAALISGFNLAFVFFSVLLPTVIHVFVFTGAFMLFGALKSHSRMGYLSVAFYLTIFIGLLFLSIDIGSYSVSSFVQDAYLSFEGVNLEIMNLLNITNPDIQYSIYQSPAGLAIMRFLAFAYTYHYLNWFSKTEVIKWHLVPKRQLVMTIVMWLAAVFLYLVSYQLGLIALYFLSMIHVVLEFPLNHRSFIGIGKLLPQRLAGRPG